MPKTHNHSIPTRIQVLTLRALSIPNKTITTHFSITDRGIQSLYRRALSRGWNPSLSIALTEEHVRDAPRSGRPKNMSLEQEARIVRAAMEAAERGEVRSLGSLSEEFGCSRSTVGRVLGITPRRRRTQEEMRRLGLKSRGKVAVDGQQTLQRSLGEAVGSGGVAASLGSGVDLQSVARLAETQSQSHQIEDEVMEETLDVESSEDEEESFEDEGQPGPEQQQDFETHLHAELMSWASKSSGSEGQQSSESSGGTLS